VITLNNGLQTDRTCRLVQGLRPPRPPSWSGSNPPSGWLHFTDIDADLYFGAHRGLFGSKSWMAKIGRQGGTTKSQKGGSTPAGTGSSAAAAARRAA